MLSPFTLFWRALKQWWGDIYALWLVNLFWTLSTLLVVTAPPAAAALNALARQTAQDETIQWSHFLRQMRRYFWSSWVLMLVDGFILLLIVANYQFWGRFVEEWAHWVQGFWGAAFLIWLLWQLYLYPALVAQARPNILRTLRNAFLLMVNEPLRTVGLGLLCLALLTASVGVVFPIFMATPAIIAVACNGAYLTWTSRNQK